MYTTPTNAMRDIMLHKFPGSVHLGFRKRMVPVYDSVMDYFKHDRRQYRIFANSVQRNIVDSISDNDIAEAVQNLEFGDCITDFSVSIAKLLINRGVQSGIFVEIHGYKIDKTVEEWFGEVLERIYERECTNTDAYKALGFSCESDWLNQSYPMMDRVDSTIKIYSSVEDAVGIVIDIEQHPWMKNWSMVGGMINDVVVDYVALAEYFEKEFK
jgi:hypothetical protein